MPMMRLELICMIQPKRQKQIYDAKVKANQYKAGDLVQMETYIGQLNIAPKLRVPYEGPYTIQKWLGALDYELHMDHGKRMVVHQNRLKPYHGLKRPPGYYHALAEAKTDDPQSQVLVESLRQKLTPVFQVRQLCRQREAPLLTELVCPELTGGSSSCCGSQGPQTGWLYSPKLEDVAVTDVLT